MSEELLHSPLESQHLELGGRMVPFAGWNMPVMYDSILHEHRAVRETAGVFDISHMGQFLVRGSGSATWLNGMLANDLGKLEVGQGQYSFLLNEAGGVIDDLIVYRDQEEGFFLVVNASMIAEDYSWLQKHLPDGVELVDESEQWAGMAVQGPQSAAAFEKVFAGEALPPRNGIVSLECGAVICRTGYTGEDGYECFVPASQGGEVFRKFIDAGAKPCGLGARDTLRLEMCYPLNGSDLSSTRTPLEAGLGFFVDVEGGGFIGHDAVAEQKKEGLKERLVAIQYLEKGAPPRAHYKVLDGDGVELSELTSGALSPSLGKGIGMAYLPVASAKVGTPLQIDVRGRRFPAEVVKKPFYKPKA